MSDFPRMSIPDDIESFMGVEKKENEQEEQLRQLIRDYQENDPKKWEENKSWMLQWLDELEYDGDLQKELEKETEERIRKYSHESLKKEIETILQETNTNNKYDIEIFEKEDIKEILHFKDDATALRFLRVALKYGYGMKVGKTYKITKKNFEKMLKFLEGQEFDF